MRHRPLLALGALAAGAFLLAARNDEPVDASTVLRMGISQLAARAGLIVEGRVQSAEVLETPGGLVETEYSLAVARTFLGAHHPERRLRLPGGTLPDGRGMLLPGMPTLAAGEDVLLFVSAPEPSGRCMPIGLAQGKYGLVSDADGRRTLVGDASGVVLVDGAGPPRPGPGTTRIDYAAAVAEIHAALEQRAHAALPTEEQR